MSSSSDPSKPAGSAQKTDSAATATIEVNGQTTPFAGGTVSDLLEELSIKTRAIAVELNQEIVPADQHHTTNVSPGDKLEIVTLVGGG